MFWWYIAAIILVYSTSVFAFIKSPRSQFDLLRISSLVMLNTFICQVFIWTFGELTSALAGILVDFPLAVWVYYVWLKRPNYWKLGLIGCLVSQVTLHILTLFMWERDILTPQLLWLYMWYINSIFLGILGILVYAGVRKEKHE